MSLQRYFVSPNQWNDSHVVIQGDDAAHIAKVMRMKPGEKVICSNGEGVDFIVELQTVSNSEVVARQIEKLENNREPSIQVTIAQGLAKGDKMDLVIQKGTEIGMAKLIPFSSSRAIVQLDAKKESKRIERWEKIAKEAAEQSHRSIIPEISAVLTWKELIQSQKHVDLKLVAYENESTLSIQKALTSAPEGVKNIILVIGPEGGLSEEEVNFAVENGFQSVQLGKRILRTETAGLVGLSCLLYHYGEMGG